MAKRFRARNNVLYQLKKIICKSCFSNYIFTKTNWHINDIQKSVRQIYNYKTFLIKLELFLKSDRSTCIHMLQSLHYNN